LGFKKSCRSTNYVVQTTVENAIRTANQLGNELVEVKIKGLGYAKESSLRGL
jgi:ribosomal protein S11